MVRQSAWRKFVLKIRPTSITLRGKYITQLCLIFARRNIVKIREDSELQIFVAIHLEKILTVIISYDGNGNWGFGIKTLPVGMIGPGFTLLRVS